MAEESGGGATPWLAFLVGGLIVVVAVIAFFVYRGGAPQPAMPKSVDVNLNMPKPTLPDAPKLPDVNPTPK
jgi:hypothetical protein